MLAGVAMVNPLTKRVVKAVTLSTLMSYAMAEFVSNVKVSSASNDLWVLVGWIDVANGCRSALYQLNKASLVTVHTYKLGCSRQVELDRTSRWVYLTEAPFYDDRGQDAQPLTKATVVAINGSTGAVNRAAVPSPTSGIFSPEEHYEPTSIAFDRKNYGIYVAGQGTVWIYTTKLKLVHVTALNYDPTSALVVAANLTTNLIYVTDGKVLTEIFGPTGNVRRTSVLSGGSTMVIDTKSNVLYLGTNTVRLSTLLSTGKPQPHRVQAVDPSTHARYSVESSKLYITR